MKHSIQKTSVRRALTEDELSMITAGIVPFVTSALSALVSWAAGLPSTGDLVSNNSDGSDEVNMALLEAIKEEYPEEYAESFPDA